MITDIRFEFNTKNLTRFLEELKKSFPVLSDFSHLIQCENAFISTQLTLVVENRT